MADRTHETENELTGADTSRSKTSPDRGEARGTTPAVSHVTQEGRVDTVGGGPSGTDGDDRRGEGQGQGLGRREEGRAPDTFVSTEVNDRTTTPGRDSKTRS